MPVLVVKGLYLEQDNRRGVGIVDDFGEALAKSPYFTVKPEERASVQPDEWAASYTIRLSLKKPLTP